LSKDKINSCKEKIIIMGGIGLFLSSFLPVFPDPYYHREKVDFWTWLGREINESRTGERRLRR